MPGFQWGEFWQIVFHSRIFNMAAFMKLERLRYPWLTCSTKAKIHIQTLHLHLEMFLPCWIWLVCLNGITGCWQVLSSKYPPLLDAVVHASISAHSQYMHLKWDLNPCRTDSTVGILADFSVPLAALTFTLPDQIQLGTIRIHHVVKHQQRKDVRNYFFLCHWFVVAMLSQMMLRKDNSFWCNPCILQICAIYSMINAEPSFGLTLHCTNKTHWRVLF